MLFPLSKSQIEVLMATYSLGLGVKAYKVIPLLRTHLSTDFASIFHVRLGPSLIWDIHPIAVSFEVGWFPVQYASVRSNFLANSYGPIGNIANTLGTIGTPSGLITSLYTVGLGIRVLSFNAMVFVSNKTLSVEAGVTLPVVFYGSEATCETTIVGICK